MERNILVVDDEKLIVKGLKLSLEQEGFHVDCEYDGAAAIEAVKAKVYDLVLLDVMLPAMNGYEVCAQIRTFSDVPVIMLTAKSEDIDKIMGLEYGADDYITKPFNILEVKARIKAIFRRNERKNAPAAEQKIFSFDEISLDAIRRTVKIYGKEINLRAKEFELLEFLMSHPEHVYSREELQKEVWGSDSKDDLRTVDVHVRRLREKIEQNPASPEYVHTKWGVGYYFKH